MSELSDYLIEAARDRGIEGVRAFARAVDITSGQASRLLSGKHTPKEETLRLIASKLGVSYDRLRVLNGLLPEASRFELPRQFDYLPVEDRRLLTQLGWRLLREHLDGRDASQPTSPKRHTSGHGEVVEVDFPKQGVTEVVWEPAESHDPVTHKE